MELVASLPPDLAASADPTARAAAPPLRSSRQDDAAAAASAPFDLLLALLTVPMPTGERLPAAGNALPVAADDVNVTDGAAKPVTPPSPGGAGTDLLARLKLSLAAAESVAPPAVEAPPPADASAAQGAAVAKPAGPDLAAPVPLQVQPAAAESPVA
ncbi:MAG TPA: hypothetical protein VHH11_05880, partial [Gammaproteobacteria bacterium]|nr:hypothetical protein [Gammaproteobacteria bacterium]